MFRYKDPATCLSILLLATTLTFAQTAEASVISDCYQAWSRCSSWSSVFNGVLWLSCPDRCEEMGYRGGNCVPVPSICPVSDTTLQCQCY